MAKSTRHTMVVVVECDSAVGAHEAEERFMRFVKAHANSVMNPYGFWFYTAGRVAAKQIPPNAEIRKMLKEGVHE